MVKDKLSFCCIRIVNAHVAIFKVNSGINVLSKKNLKELDHFLEKRMTPPYGLISDSRDVDFCLSPDAIIHATTSPAPSVVATIAYNTSLVEKALSILRDSGLEHKAFSSQETAIAWVKEKLNLS